MENIADEEMTLYYQIDYTLTEIADDAAYLHAQFRRVNPLPLKQDYTIVEGIKGEGQYVGTHMSWGVNSTGWWGEGEIKFFMDGDDAFATIVGPGPRTISAARTTSRTGRRGNIRSSRRRTRGCRSSSGLTAYTSRSSASGCTAGTSWTRSASSRTCA
jgi:hypothetical protein